MSEDDKSPKQPAPPAASPAADSGPKEEVKDEAKAKISGLLQFSATFTAELQSKMKRLDHIINRTHWLSVGNYKEAILREHLRSKVPNKVEVGTGFVLAVQGKETLLSRQIDILVWDASNYAPFFKDGEFVIVPPEACRGAIEVKSRLTGKEIKKGFRNLDSLSKFVHFKRPGNVLHKALFAYEIDPKLKWPDSVWSYLSRGYRESKEIDFDARINWSRHDLSGWAWPWINEVAVLGTGALGAEHWRINGKHDVCYVAYDTAADDINDTYGFVERRLVSELLAGEMLSTMHMTHPGANSVFMANQRVPRDGVCVMAVPGGEPIAEFANLQGAALAAWAARFFTPPNPAGVPADPADADEDADDDEEGE